MEAMRKIRPDETNDIHEPIPEPVSTESLVQTALAANDNEVGFSKPGIRTEAANDNELAALPESLEVMTANDNEVPEHVPVQEGVIGQHALEVTASEAEQLHGVKERLGMIRNEGIPVPESHELATAETAESAPNRIKGNHTTIKNISTAAAAGAAGRREGGDAEGPASKDGKKKSLWGLLALPFKVVGWVFFATLALAMTSILKLTDRAMTFAGGKSGGGGAKKAASGGDHGGGHH